MTTHHSLVPDALLDRVAQRFRVLGDASRLAIVRLLVERGEASVGEVVDAVGMSQANVSKHLRLLLDAGIVSRRREGTSAYYAVVDSSGGSAALALDFADIRRARRKGIVSVVLAIENGAVLGGSTASLRNYHRLGVRLLGVTWNGRNDLGCGIGCRDTGVTRFGREAIQEAQALGMIIDCSHMGDRSFSDRIQSRRTSRCAPDVGRGASRFSEGGGAACRDRGVGSRSPGQV